MRAALVNEQLTELDYRIQRWSRVPRVCASIATSFGFMLATLVLRKGLATPATSRSRSASSSSAVWWETRSPWRAMGIVGTAFCIGAQAEAKRIAKARIAGADKLVERLEALLGAVNRGRASAASGLKSPVLTLSSSVIIATGNFPSRVTS